MKLSQTIVPLLIGVVACRCGGRLITDGAADVGAAPPPPAVPTSCRSSAPGTDSRCGPSADLDCCASLLVPGGDFFRIYDGAAHAGKALPASVSSFYLDAHHVTVGRFRAFVDAYSFAKPKAGDGAHPRIAGSGWRIEWPLAADAASLRTALRDPATCVESTPLPPAPTWTDSPGENERMPINCLSWYELFAFCAWDGGRIPTQNELNYARSGGGEHRVYPWSSPPSSTIMDERFAVYSPDERARRPRPEAVGSRPLGRGRWGHFDLSGNVLTPVIDRWPDIRFPNPCVDCAVLSDSADREVTMGDAYAGGSSLGSAAIPAVLVSRDERAYGLGGRCAR